MPVKGPSALLCLSRGCGTALKRRHSPQKGGRKGCFVGPGHGEATVPYSAG